MLNNVYTLQKSTTCFDHTQLTVEANKVSKEVTSNDGNKLKIYGTMKSIDKVSVNEDKSEKSKGARKRSPSISTQIKTTHNKSEIGLKEKKICTIHNKDKNIKSSDVLSNIATPLAKHVLIKTF